MDTVSNAVHHVFLGAAACFVIGLHLMNDPRTARRGDTLEGDERRVPNLTGQYAWAPWAKKAVDEFSVHVTTGRLRFPAGLGAVRLAQAK